MTTTIQLVNTQELKALTQDHTKITVVEFGADWCSACKASLPVMEQMQAEYPQHNWVRVDIDVSNDLVKLYKIRTAPTFVSFKDGAEYKIQTGRATKLNLQTLIQ